MTKPKLYVFTISHFCEKARWGLDYLDIDYELVLLSPISHAQNAKQLGLSRASVPILETSDGVIQGSDHILTWAEETSQSSNTPNKNFGSKQPKVLAIEERLDSVVGVHIRRLFYSEALVDHPDTVLRVFVDGMPQAEQDTIRALWPKVRESMIARMDLGAEQFDESLNILEAEFNWLDDMLKANNGYLASDQFTRADLTAASLISPLCKPAEHPTAHLLEITPRLEAFIAQASQRPIYQWLLDTYAAHR